MWHILCDAQYINPSRFWQLRCVCPSPARTAPCGTPVDRSRVPVYGRTETSTSPRGESPGLENSHSAQRKRRWSARAKIKYRVQSVAAAAFSSRATHQEKNGPVHTSVRRVGCCQYQARRNSSRESEMAKIYGRFPIPPYGELRGESSVDA